ncbi:hypothetical protein M5K25_011293 [Dendrobium thyrsiflorum]|uniref:Uncharacterized protein n=1 Tax=Dendrobium thyrsiflorum TaxID=117978 RepID=A0ABD0V2E0_DENTH
MKKEVIQLNPEMTPLDTSILPWCLFHDTYTKKMMFNYFIDINRATSDAEMIICNCFEMLEKPVFKEMPYILPIGPLHNSFESRGDPNLCHFWSEDKQCISWLNKHPANSVIYVAFGSITIFNIKQFQELALGLELIGLSFVPDENGLISEEEVGSKVQDLLEDRDILARSQALKNFSDTSVMKGGSSFKNLNKFADFVREN